MSKTLNLSIFEIIWLIFTSTMTITGIVISHINIDWFENHYAVEDGFVENWTVIPLLIAAIYAITLFVRLRESKGRIFKFMMICIALFSIFVAGEEMSWGQRIFDVESSDFFRTHNAQGETNLHNMIVGGQKVNKIIFSQLMTVGIAFFLLILPILYRKKPKIRKFCDGIGIPIAQNYQIIASVILFSSTILIPSGKNAEILEAGITSLFLLILLFPANKYAFNLPQKKLNIHPERSTAKIG